GHSCRPIVAKNGRGETGLTHWGRWVGRCRCGQDTVSSFIWFPSRGGRHWPTSGPPWKRGDRLAPGPPSREQERMDLSGRFPTLVRHARHVHSPIEIPRTKTQAPKTQDQP